MSNGSLRLVGIIGGTFDPIHYGHLRMALEVSERLALDEVRFIPAARPPHRGKPAASDRQRLAMVKQAISGEPHFMVDDREYRREADSYMVDTLESLRAEVGEKVSLLLIMGADAFLGLASWHRWQRLLALAHIVVVDRPASGQDIESELPGRDLALKKLYDSHHSTDQSHLNQKRCGSIFTMSTTALGISASSIRKMIAAQKSARFLLPEAVLTYINEHNLYR